MAELRRSPVHIDLSPPTPRTAMIMGDPARVRLVAEALGGGELLSTRRGYHIVRAKAGGREVLVASHGIGGPSLLILVEELAMLGVRRFIRLGTTGAFAGGLGLGDVVVATGACMIPGTCGLALYARGVQPPLSPDPFMASEAVRLLRGAGLPVREGRVFCSDAFYAESPEVFREAERAGCASVDMETAALYGVSAVRGLRSLSVLVVSNVIRGDGGEELAPRELLEDRFRVIARALVPLVE